MRALAASVLFACLWLSSSPTACAQTNEAPSLAAESQALSSPVTVGDRVLFPVHGIKANTAPQRAANISERLIEASEEPGFNPDSVAVIETAISSDITAGDRILLSVFDSDARAEGRGRQELAADWAAKVRSGMAQHIKDYGVRSILIGAAWAALATLALARKSIPAGRPGFTAAVGQATAYVAV